MMLSSSHPQGLTLFKVNSIQRNHDEANLCPPCPFRLGFRLRSCLPGWYVYSNFALIRVTNWCFGICMLYTIVKNVLLTAEGPRIQRTKATVIYEPRI